MNFDLIASYYDLLVRLVFGSIIFKSQTVHFHRIGKGARVLIVGGGTGWILEHLPSHCNEVLFIEPSNKMIQKARTRDLKCDVCFRCERFENIKINSDYDVIITNFFFDLFNNQRGLTIARNLKSHLRGGGIWILTDFENSGQMWQGILLKLMYLFFKITTGLKTQKLHDWRCTMDMIEMIPIKNKTYYNNFIVSVCYKSKPGFYGSST